MIHTYSYDIVSTISFFFHDTATTEIYTLSLHDALPISHAILHVFGEYDFASGKQRCSHDHCGLQSVTDRKSTRLNSSHTVISYAVFCLKKKKKKVKTNVKTNMST